MIASALLDSVVIAFLSLIYVKGKRLIDIFEMPYNHELINTLKPMDEKVLRNVLYFSKTRALNGAKYNTPLFIL